MHARSIVSITALLFLLTSCVPGGGLDSPDNVPTGAEVEKTGASEFGNPQEQGGSEFGNPQGGSEFGNPIALVTGQLKLIAEKAPSGNEEPAPGDNPGFAGDQVGLAPGFTTGGSTVPEPPAPGPGSFATPPKLICGVDHVKLTASDGEVHESDIQDDCSFRIEVPSNQLYHMSFWSAGSIQSRLVVSVVGGVPLHTFNIPASDTPLDLGAIARTGKIATAANDPRAWSDRDGDGLNDKDDPDDDNDGIPDVEEPDCDLDGFPDDGDEDSACSAGGSSSGPRVLAASPFSGETDIGELQKIRVKVSCPVDVGQFDSGKIKLEDEVAATIACVSVLFVGNTVIECTHALPFVHNMTYTATLLETDCDGGESIPQTSWTFKTAL